MAPLRFALLALALAVAGCAGFDKLDAGAVVARNRIQVTLDGPWNKWQGPGDDSGEVWTRDGLPLDTLIFHGPVKAGEPLWTVRQRNDKSVPKFRSEMRPHEIVELYEAMVAADGSVFRLDRLAPDPFLGGEGFRFDFALTRKGDELAMRGAGFGAVSKGELYLMVFRAPRLYYFDRHLPAVESIARSARLTG